MARELESEINSIPTGCDRNPTEADEHDFVQSKIVDNV